MRESIPKAVGFWLITKIQEQIQYELYTAVNSQEELSREMGEPPEITAERKTLKESIETMKKSLKVLQRDPEITATLNYDDELSRDIKDSLAQEKKMKELKEQQRRLAAQGGPPPGGMPGEMTEEQKRMQAAMLAKQQAQRQGGAPPKADPLRR